MKEKDGLDRRVSISWSEKGKDFYVNRSKKKIKERMANFNENSGKCKDLTMKEKEPKIKIYWCKIIDKPCKYLNCPKVKSRYERAATKTTKED